MSEGIVTALSGALVRQQQLDDVSHNLANLDTAGFRQQRVSFREVLVDAERGVHYVGRSEQQLDLTEGPAEQTGDPLHVAITGPGFFRVGGEGDQVSLTRDGTFRMDNFGNLVTTDGRPVLDEAGAPILLQATPEEIVIDDLGVISDAFGEVGRIGYVDVQDPGALRAMGRGTYTTDERNLKPATGSITQGSLERSNVNPMRGMADMITLQRHFEAMNNLIQMHRSADEKAIQTVGAARI